MNAMLRQLRPAIVSVVAFTVLLGLAYPLAVLAVNQVAFHDKANGSLVKVDGKVVGSKLIGQGFAAEEYFHPRPSAAGAGYDGESSSGSNLGPSNPDYLTSVEERAVAYREENGLAKDAPVPADAVTASGSGLDPQITMANADLQAPRVAKARNLSLKKVQSLIQDNTEERPLGFLGDPGVNVLELNLALDATGK
jgi:K+-transporting ATPase ATPase C chain